MSRHLTPQKIYEVLGRHVIGQDNARRAVAIALRNRWRRMQLSPETRAEVTPRNILMIGPTGVGKTEIARRLAVLADAPFIKVEATKFTEVGYVGRDVDSIIRDLAVQGRSMAQEEFRASHEERARSSAREHVLDRLRLKPGLHSSNLERQLDAGRLDDVEIDVEVEEAAPSVNATGAPGMEAMMDQISKMMPKRPPSKTLKKMRVVDAMRLLTQQEADRMIDESQVESRALDLVEQNGIVFIDEIDKVCPSASRTGGEVSREGVQRDLLPLIEGSTVTTSIGQVRTDHILFIASGAFHYTKPSDMIPELQGRLPIRVELEPLSVEDFKRILTEPEHALLDQYRSLLGVDGGLVEMTDGALGRIAELAWQINQESENIGARRLHTLMEKLFEDSAYRLPADGQVSIRVDEAFVEAALGALLKKTDSSRFIL
ncbi:MAG: ATP-dependent protease ATPase subunit HslU [Gammaproteobacteria bacterium AqS3]|nr:ATP-dependent protease ATPase subunit HslU [Gammaproteobacteria bacterium AqS3]